MSVEIDWDQLTSGPDGASLAEQIRAFLHDRFQTIPLPRFIRSVEVHSFDFGSVAPDLEVKDVCDPLPDFYDSDDEEEDDAAQEGREASALDASAECRPQSERASYGHGDALGRVPGLAEHRGRDLAQDQRPSTINIANSSSSSYFPSGSPLIDTQSPSLRSQTPGIPGGTSNLSYFHLPLSAGISGATTSLAAVAGLHLPASGWPDYQTPHLEAATPHRHARDPMSPRDPWLRHTGTVPTLPSEAPSRNEPNPDDIQIVMHFRYSGDLRINMTADILLDYPMPSFVGIPLQLNVTGMTFDGVAILAYIKRKAHFCFLSPEDADALVGGSSNEPSDAEAGLESAAMEAGDDSAPGRGPETRGSRQQKKPVGTLFDEVKVESEIGQRGSNTKPVLKNVGKVERFVLEQVRRIFENELVYPSFWTFLV